MSDDSKYKGTGDAIGRIDLGEIGTLVIKDDGDADSYTNVHVADGNGNMAALSATMIHYRQEEGDAWVEEQLEAHKNRAQRRPQTTEPDADPRVAFSCPGCGLTWPGRQNQNPGSGPDACPTCAEDDD